MSHFESIASWKAYWVDTSARILWYVPLLGLWEKFGVGMDNAEILASRSIAIAWNLFLGRFHGKVREWLSKATGIDEHSSGARKLALDTATGMVVTFVSYTTTLMMAGVSLDKAFKAIPFALAFGIATGRPYGRFLDWYRKKWGTLPVLNR